jgi:hypothetical protein
MSWTIKLVATNAYIQTDTNGAVDHATINPLITSGAAFQQDLLVYAANPQRTLNTEANIIDDGVAIASGEYVDEMTLHVLPYYFTINDSARQALMDYLTSYYWYYIRNSDYPAWWDSRNNPSKWWAVRIAALEHEHKHQTGVKYLRVKLYFTRW